MKLGDIANAVLEELIASCAECGVTNDTIDKQSFICVPESSSYYVTYRARLEGTSETESGSLISLIEDWVSDHCDWSTDDSGHCMFSGYLISQ